MFNRLAGNILSFVLLSFAIFTQIGCRKAVDSATPAAATTSVENQSEAIQIDRATFSMLLPNGWSEDTADDMHDPDSFVFFENPESCLFFVMIADKSTGATVDDLLIAQKHQYEIMMTNSVVTNLTRWATYDVKGFEINGKAQGIVRSNAKLHGFVNGNNVCVVIEFAELNDLKTYGNDFETIRQSFKLK